MTVDYVYALAEPCAEMLAAGYRAGMKHGHKIDPRLLRDIYAGMLGAVPQPDRKWCRKCRRWHEIGEFDFNAKGRLLNSCRSSLTKDRKLYAKKKSAPVRKYQKGLQNGSCAG